MRSGMGKVDVFSEEMDALMPDQMLMEVSADSVLWKALIKSGWREIERKEGLALLVINFAKA